MVINHLLTGMILQVIRPYFLGGGVALGGVDRPWHILGGIPPSQGHQCAARFTDASGGGCGMVRVVKVVKRTQDTQPMPPPLEIRPYQGDY